MLNMVLISVAVIGGLGLVFGLGLGVASKKMAVEKNETISDIVNLLPGINCGGCGRPGCDAFAKDLYAGDASISECKPCVSENAIDISKILGVEASEEKKLVARVMCVGVKDKSVSKYIYGGLEDCRAAAELSGGPKACSVGCMGLGTCQNVCEYGAITVNKKDGLAIVDADKCVGCGICAVECPKNTITMMDPELSRTYISCRIHQKGKAVSDICKAGCIGCGICERECKFDAITMVDNLPIINYDKCVHCGVCARKCPKDAITHIKKTKKVIMPVEKAL